MKTTVRRSVLVLLTISLCALGTTICRADCGKCHLKKPKLAVELPEKYNTPDGMAVGPDGNIYVSIPNFGNDKYPAKILKISKDDKITEFCDVPAHPDTKKACPLGIGFASDGNLYIADCQALGGAKDFKSRLLRVVIKDGKAVKVEPVVTGFIMANAVSGHGDCVYVTETELDGKPDPMPSGVYRFKLSELSGDKPIKLKPGGKDKHLIAKLYTKNKEWRVGANGLGFDSKGNMFVCNFGDAAVNKITFDKKGKVQSNEVFAQGQGMLCTDGLKVCPKTGDIFIADFLGNAVHRVCAKTGKVTTLAKNDDTDGKGGLLDKPSEVCLRGNKLYVANIDLPMAGNTHDKPHTISVIVLGK